MVLLDSETEWQGDKALPWRPSTRPTHPPTNPGPSNYSRDYPVPTATCVRWVGSQLRCCRRFASCGIRPCRARPPSCSKSRPALNSPTLPSLPHLTSPHPCFLSRGAGVVTGGRDILPSRRHMYGPSKIHRSPMYTTSKPRQPGVGVCVCMYVWVDASVWATGSWQLAAGSWKQQ